MMLFAIPALFLLLRIACAENLRWAVCWPTPVLLVWAAASASLIAAQRLLERVSQAAGQRSPLTSGNKFFLPLAAAVMGVALVPHFDGAAFTWRLSPSQSGRPLAIVGVALAGIAAVRWRESRETRSDGMLRFRGLLLSSLLLTLGMWAAAAVMSPSVFPWLDAGQTAYLVAATLAWAALVHAIDSPSLAPHLRFATWGALVLVFPGLPAIHFSIHAASGAPAQQYASDNRPDVFLLTADTLRADARARFSRIAALAEDGIEFTHAIAQSSWTQPSMASLLTSAYPSETGFGRTPTQPMDTPTTGVLNSAVPTLATLLSRGGYQTAAVLTNGLLDSQHGFSAGFSLYSHANRGTYFRSLALVAAASLLTGVQHGSWKPNEAVSMVDSAMRQLDHLHSSRRPLFLWVHFIDPHGPYHAPNSPLNVSLREMQRYRTKKEEAAPRRRDEIKAAYNHEIRYLDAAVGTLLDGLRNRGLYDRSLIVFTSDHGEEFWEHGGVEHGHTLYDELVRVPLLVKLPGNVKPGLTVDGVVGLLDVPATIIDVASIDRPATFRGRSLLGQLDGEAASSTPTVLSEGTIGGRYAPVHEKKALRTDRFTIISTPALDEYEVFDLGGNAGRRGHSVPNGQSPLQLQEQLAHWTSEMFAHAQSLKAGSPSGLDAETKERLRALGYLE